jgi:hypothetical protein
MQRKARFLSFTQKKGVEMTNMKYPGLWFVFISRPLCGRRCRRSANAHDKALRDQRPSHCRFRPQARGHAALRHLQTNLLGASILPSGDFCFTTDVKDITMVLPEGKLLMPQAS